MEFRNAEISLRMIAPGGTVHLTGNALIDSCPFFSTTHFLMVRIFLYTCDISGRGGKGWEGGGRHSREIWVEVYGRGLQTLQTVLNTKIVHFASLFKTREIILWRSWFILFSNKMDFFFSQNNGIWLFRKKHLWYHKFRPFIVTLLSKKTPFPRR